MAATLTGALTATAEPRKVEVMAAILMCVVTCKRDTVVTGRASPTRFLKGKFLCLYLPAF